FNPGIPRNGEVRLDSRVLGFTALLSLLTGILFGLVPALQSSKPDLNDALKTAGGGTGGHERKRVRSLLVVTEVALSLVLLIGAGLMLQSFARLQRENPGFKPVNLLVADIDMASSSYVNDVARRVFFAQLLERVSAVPGVQSTCGAAMVPPGGTGWP